MKAYSTTTTTSTAANDHGTISWSLQKFAVGKDLRWDRTKDGDDRSEVFVDRATHEFGVVYYDLYSAAAVQQFPDTDEPVFFQASNALAACWHSKCKKVSLLCQHLQVDLGFHSIEEARDFLDTFEDATATTQNLSFCTYEHSSITKFRDDSFDMVQDQLTGRVIQSWMDGRAVSSEWSTLRQTGQWSDFTITAGDRLFAVHRIRLCQESDYFKAVCDGNFMESSDRRINLPESERTVDILLDELYDTYNSTTGSLFTGFALRSKIEKERILNDLLDVFIASDKYSLEKVKTKVAKAIIDRLPFIHDVLTVVDLATCIFDEECPQVDRGLRKAIITQVYSRMPQIMNDEAAWQEYSKNKAVMKALHVHMFYDALSVGHHTAATAPQCLSPTAAPTAMKRKRTS